MLRSSGAAGEKAIARDSPRDEELGEQLIWTSTLCNGLEGVN